MPSGHRSWHSQRIGKQVAISTVQLCWRLLQHAPAGEDRLSLLQEMNFSRLDEAHSRSRMDYQSQGHESRYQVVCPPSEIRQESRPPLAPIYSKAQKWTWCQVALP